MSREMQLAAIRVEGVSFSFGEHRVLDAITTTLDRQEFVCLLGANGTGKMTLLRIVTGELVPETGSVQIGAPEIIGNSEAERTPVTYLPQRLPTPEYLSVRELVAMSRYRSSNAWGWRPTEEDRSAVDAAMARCNVDAMADRPFDQLSGGEAQRTWLAFCLAQRQAFVLMDEPLHALDFRSRREFFGLLSQIPREQGTGVAITAHEVGLAEEFADRIVVLREGRAVWDGPPGAENLGKLL